MYIHTIASNPDQQDECHVMLAAVLLIAVTCMSSGGDFGSAIHRKGINSYLIISLALLQENLSSRYLTRSYTKPAQTS